MAIAEEHSTEPKQQDGDCATDKEGSGEKVHIIARAAPRQNSVVATRYGNVQIRMFVKLLCGFVTLIESPSQRSGWENAVVSVTRGRSHLGTSKRLDLSIRGVREHTHPTIVTLFCLSEHCHAIQPSSDDSGPLVGIFSKTTPIIIVATTSTCEQQRNKRGDHQQARVHSGGGVSPISVIATPKTPASP
jgi:hypothetical protein